MYTICIVEDEIKLNDLIKTYLEKASYNVIQCHSGSEALNVSCHVDLWILDIMLSDDKVPVIFTSARDQELDKIIGLELGSDDYVTKPYSPKELVLRVNNIIKRVYGNSLNKIVYKNYNIDSDRRTVFIGDEEIKLTNLEFELLLLLINNLGKSFKREDILNSIWEEDFFGNDRVVDDLVRRLRSKMKDLDINTIYGYGYRLV